MKKVNLNALIYFLLITFLIASIMFIFTGIFAQTVGAPKAFNSFIGFGVIFFLLCLAGLIYMLVNGRKNKVLKNSGVLVEATVTKVEPNFNVTVNNQITYIIKCEWIDPANGVKYFYKSNYITVDPSQYFEDNNISTVPVYIDEKDPDKYLIDTDTLIDNIIKYNDSNKNIANR